MPPSTKTTTLITGAAGFIGSHLTDRLLAVGHRVIGLDSFTDFYAESRKRANLADAMGHERFELIEGDIRDPGAVAEAFTGKRVDYVVHLAAMAGVRPSIERPALYVSVNLDGTANLLDAAVAHNAKRFLFGSSSSVYGNNAKVPFAETDPVDEPISPYAATKRAGELLCHTYAHLHGLPIACLRFFTVYGPRQRPDLAISKFLAKVHAGETLPMFGDGTTSRDYTFVADIVAGLEAALTLPDDLTFRIYNLGNDTPTTLADLIASVGRTVGKEPKVEQHPMQPGDVDRTWADITRARTELGYAPRVPFEEGLSQQWAWMQEKT